MVAKKLVVVLLLAIVLVSVAMSYSFDDEESDFYESDSELGYEDDEDVETLGIGYKDIFNNAKALDHVMSYLATLDGSDVDVQFLVQYFQYRKIVNSGKQVQKAGELANTIYDKFFKKDAKLKVPLDGTTDYATFRMNGAAWTLKHEAGKEDIYIPAAQYVLNRLMDTLHQNKKLVKELETIIYAKGK